MIVIGASLGGLKALHKLLAGLPRSFPAPVAVVVHRQREPDALLSLSLQRHCAMPVIEAGDKETIRPGCVYLGPPDYHLLVDADCFSLSADEPVKFARPSIDVLFESAADILGVAVTGVILTGSGQDGADGAASVHRRGGLVIVQDPASAECSVTPAAALAAVPSARVLPLEQIAESLAQCCNRTTP